MANVIRFSTGLSLEIAVDALDRAIFAYYTRLDTPNHPNGEVQLSGHTQQFIVPFDDPAGGFRDVVRRVEQWAGEIQANHSFTSECLPDLPLELDTVIPVPGGLRYEIKMAGMIQEMLWTESTDEVTIEAVVASVISIEAFCYFVRTLKDFVSAIEAA